MGVRTIFDPDRGQARLWLPHEPHPPCPSDSDGDDDVDDENDGDNDDGDHGNDDNDGTASSLVDPPHLKTYRDLSPSFQPTPSR